MTTNQTETQSQPALAAHKLSVDTCVKAIGNCLIAGRKALVTELAVCLAMFAASESTKTAREVVMGIYMKAGYKCATSTDLHYKTVNRRLNASAGLFEKVGKEVVEEWVGKANEEKLISAIERGLSQYEFSTMDDVREFIGKDNNRTRPGRPKKGAAKKADKPEVPMLKFVVGKIRVQVPEESSSADLIKLAARILAAGRKKEQEELKVAIAHPSTAPNVGVATPALH